MCKTNTISLLNILWSGKALETVFRQNVTLKRYKTNTNTLIPPGLSLLFIVWGTLVCMRNMYRNLFMVFSILIKLHIHYHTYNKHLPQSRVHPTSHSLLDTGNSLHPLDRSNCMLLLSRVDVHTFQMYIAYLFFVLCVSVSSCLALVGYYVFQ